MRTILIGGAVEAPELALGCMRMSALNPAEAARVAAAAVENGITFFDHADIYGGGASEEVFARALRDAGIPRDTLLVQTKCGIRKGMYDFSREHILEAVEGSLRRLQTDYVDFLLLHRPDALMEPDEVNEAFMELHEAGKVRYFGVSNHNPLQIELLNRALGQKICVNQLQFGVMHSGMVDAGLHVNMKDDASPARDGSVLDYCRLNEITIQAWSPYQYGFFEGVFLDNPKFPELNKVIGRVAADHGVTNTAVAAAWICRHPARIQTILGTMNPQRIADACRAGEFTLSREEWYQIYLAAGNTLP